MHEMLVRVISFVFCIALILSKAACSQVPDPKPKLTFETELTIDPIGQGSLSQYLFLNDAHDRWNVALRYFTVEQVGPHHLEFLFGPNLHVGHSFLVKTAAGITSSGAWTAGCTVIVDKGRLIYIVDPKWYGRKPDTIFQKLMLPSVIKIGGYPITFRAELLTVAGNTANFRLGPEFRVITFKGSMGPGSIFISPFYDIQNDGLGSFITARF
jgi:hypothetical protein